MLSYAKKLVATTLVSSTLVLGGLAPMAAAQPTVVQGGLVNVNIGNVTIPITIEDVNVAVAANLAASACDLVDVQGVNLAVLAQAVQVVRTGDSQTICTSEAGDVTISQE